MYELTSARLLVLCSSHNIPPCCMSYISQIRRWRRVQARGSPRESGVLYIRRPWPPPGRVESKSWPLVLPRGYTQQTCSVFKFTPQQHAATIEAKRNQNLVKTRLEQIHNVCTRISKDCFGLIRLFSTKYLPTNGSYNIYIEPIIILWLCICDIKYSFGTKVGGMNYL